MENGQEKPIIVEYHSLNEKGANGVDYMRIYDDGFRFRKDPYNPVKTQLDIGCKTRRYSSMITI